MKPEGIVDFQSANSVNGIHDRKLGEKIKTKIDGRLFIVVIVVIVVLALKE